MKFYKERVRKIRKSKRLSIDGMSELGNFGKSSLSNWELGKKIPSESKVRSIAHVLGVSVNEISDLDSFETSDYDLSSFHSAWLNFASVEEEKMVDSYHNELVNLQEKYSEMHKVSIIVRTLLTSFPVMFYIKDLNQKYITANAVFLEYTSAQSNRVIGKTDYYFFSKQEADINSKEDMEVLYSRKSIMNKECFIPGTRKKKRGLVSKIPITDNKGKIAGLIVTFVDITERKKVEEIRLLLEKTINASNDVYWFGKNIGTHSLKMSYLFISDGVKKVFGISKNKFTRAAWKKMLHPDYKFLAEKIVDDGTYPVEREYKIIRYDGKERWLFEKINKINDSFYSGMVIDITEKKEAERVHDLLMINNDAMGDGVLIWDLKEEKYVYNNSVAEKILAYKFTENYDNNNIFNNIMHPEDKAKINKIWQSKPKAKKVEFRVIWPDNSIHWIKFIIRSSKTTKYRNNDCVLIYLTDITEKKELTSLVKLLVEKIVNKKNDLIWIINELRDEVVYVSENIKKIHGFNPKVFIGKNKSFWYKKYLHPDCQNEAEKEHGTKKWTKKGKNKIIDSKGKVKIVDMKFDVYSIENTNYIVYRLCWMNSTESG